MTLSILEVKTSRANVPPDEIGHSVGVQHLLDTGCLPERTPPAAKRDDLYSAIAVSRLTPIGRRLCQVMLPSNTVTAQP